MEAKTSDIRHQTSDSDWLFFTGARQLLAVSY